MTAFRGSRVLALTALVALLALASTVALAPAGASSGEAHAAKKCKKKNKKKCKKKKKKKGSVVRATLTWDTTPTPGGNTDLDLWAFEMSGLMGSTSLSTNIPDTVFSANNTTGGGVPEKFTDKAFRVPARKFGFGVCYHDGGSQHVRFKIDYVTPDGVHHTDSQELGSDGASATYPGGPPIPPEFCQT